MAESNGLRERARRAAFVLTFGAAASIVCSIAVSQILLGLALAALLFSRVELRFPWKWPFFLFVLATIVAMLLSDDPRAGLPQIRKFYVWGILLLITSLFRTTREIRWLVLAWGGLASIAACDGLLQFLARRAQAIEEHAVNYGFFLDSRIHGFAGHWMTFGGEEMIITLLVSAFVLFACGRRARLMAAATLPLLWSALILGLTRSIFLLGLPLGSLYLLFCWRRWTLALVPCAAALLALVLPFHVRDRIVSVVHPDADWDSNGRREIFRLTGWAMVKAHPWFGLGPERIAPHFNEFVPSNIPRPLPKGWYGHLHNIYLQYAAERGVPALLLVLWMIAQAVRDFWIALRRPVCPPDVQFILRGGIAVVIAILAEGFFEYNLGDSEVLTLFLATIACGYVAIETLRNTEHAAWLSPNDEVELATANAVPRTVVPA